METLGAISAGVDDDLFVTVAGTVCCGVFGGNHHLISVSALLHPFSYPLLRLLCLVVVCTLEYQPLDILTNKTKTRIDLRVNKVTALLVEVVQDLFSGFLVTFSHESLPVVTLSLLIM